MASLFLIASLTKDVADGLRAWRTRDHVPLTDHQILERTRNIVANIVGNYFIVPLGEEVTGWTVTTKTDRDGMWLGPFMPDSERDAIADRLRADFERDVRASRPPGVVDYHGWSCMCDRCADAKQRERS